MVRVFQLVVRLVDVEQVADGAVLVDQDPRADLEGLAEDAVLLALPMVPRKPGWEEAKAAGKPEGAGKESPFAVLASLKKRPDP